MKIHPRAEAISYALLRIVSGALFAVHGGQKMLNWLGAKQEPAFGSQMWIGGVIELVAGVLIAVGYQTRLAAFLSSGTMAVAYFQFHWKLQLSDFKWLPSVNHGELSVLYCFIFLFIAARGGGTWALRSN